MVEMLVVSVARMAFGIPDMPDPPLLPVFERMNREVLGDEGETYLREQWDIHDPSGIVEIDRYLMVAVTAKEQA